MSDICSIPRANLADMFHRPLPDRLVQGPERARQLNLVRDDIGVFAPLDLSDRDDHGLAAIGGPRHEQIEGADQLCGGGDRVLRFVRTRRMPAAAVDDHPHRIAIGGQDPGPHADSTDGPMRIDVGGEDGLDLVECSGSDHLAGPRCRLLRRFEDAREAGPAKATVPPRPSSSIATSAV